MKTKSEGSLTCFDPLEVIPYRSRARVRTHGEVFTPTLDAERLAQPIWASHWSSETVTFFEAGCGSGNILLVIALLRCKALQTKYQTEGRPLPSLRACHQTISSLWAADICQENVQICRERIFLALVAFGSQDLNVLSIERRKTFVSFLLCSLLWQVQKADLFRVFSYLSPSSHSCQPLSMKERNRRRLFGQYLRLNYSWFRHSSRCRKSRFASPLAQGIYSSVQATCSERKKLGFLDLKASQAISDAILSITDQPQNKGK